MPARDRLARTLGVLLRVRPAELPQVLVLGGWMFALVGAIWLSRAVRDSLFLARIGPAQLPYLYVASPVIVTTIGLVYARVADSFRRERLVVGTSAILAVAFIGARFVLLGGAPAYYALYIFVDIACAIVAMQFWTVAGDQFTARDAKRLIGLIAAGGTVANIVIGFGVSGLARKVSAENLLFVCAGLFAATGALAMVLAHMFGGRLGRARRRAGGTRDTRGLDAPGAGHLRLVAVIVVCGVVTFTVLDFLFKSITATALNGDRDAMVRFFGALSGVTGIVSLLIQLGVTSRLLARVGVTGVLLFLPVLLALGSSALLILPGLAAATFCKASEGTLRYTLQDAGMQLVFVPVPSQVKSRVKATIDAVVRPGTEALVGLLLLGARAIELALQPLAGVALASASIWIVTVLRLRGAYVRSLRETLRRKRLELDRMPGLRELTDAGGAAAESPEPVQPAAELLAALGDGRKVVRALAAAGPGTEPELGRVLTDEKARPAARRDAAATLGLLATADAGVALVSALGTSSETVRGAVCHALARAQRRNPGLPVPGATLRAACQREVTVAFEALAAAEGLGRVETAMNPDGTRAAPPFLRHEPEGAAALASKALRERWERARDRVFLLLQVLFPDQHLAEVAASVVDPDPVRRANAAEVLDATLDRRLRATFLPLVDDNPRYVKLNAVEGKLELPRRTRDGWVEQLLADESPWMIACAAYYAGHHDIVSMSPRLEQLAAHESPVVAEAARAALARFASQEPTTMTTVEKVLFLKGIDLFSALAGEDLADIAQIADELKKDQGEQVLVEGEHGDALYFVLEGKVAVQKGGKTVAELGERDVLGEMALLDPGPRSASAVALTDVTLLAIGREDFDDIMRERPEVPIGVMKVLVRRLRAATG